MKRILLLLVVAVILSLTLLTACTGSNKLVRTEYIKQTIPPLPAKAEYYSVQFKGVEWAPGQYDYCLDEQGAKSLLKNKALQDGREQELEQIIEGMR